MRIWLKDSERRPDPAPVKTDDRVAFLVGITGWVIALGVLVALLPTLTERGETWWLWTVVAGLAIGLIGIAYTAWHRKRS